MKIKLTLSALLMTGLISQTAFGGCTAPCTDQEWELDIMGCWMQCVYSAPVRTYYPDQQEQMVAAICNGSVTGCPEPAPPPKQTTTITREEKTCRKYSISVSGKWEVFGLNASADLEMSTANVAATTLELTGWCQRLQMDVAKRHARDTINWTRTWNTAWYCFGGNGVDTGIIVLDTFSLFIRTGDSVQPPGCIVPVPCKTTCN